MLHVLDAPDLSSRVNSIPSYPFILKEYVILLQNLKDSASESIFVNFRGKSLLFNSNIIYFPGRIWGSYLLGGGGGGGEGGRIGLDTFG